MLGLKPKDYIGYGILLIPVIVPLTQQQIRNYIFQHIMRWEVCSFVIGVLGIMVWSLYIYFRNKLENDITRVSELLHITFEQSSVRSIYLYSLWQRHTANVNVKIKLDSAEIESYYKNEREWLKNQLCREWKHKTNDEIEAMIDKVYISVK